MYLPSHYREDSTSKIHTLIQTNPLATLVLNSPDGLIANHIPMVLQDGSSPDGFGTLQGHVARGNALSKLEHPIAALAIFHGPQAYITPNWYPEKRSTGKVVPTWNYVVVHVHGILHTVDDPPWLLEHLTMLTSMQEKNQPDPWQMEDAPPEYMDGMVRAVMGVELTIQRLEGKWKASQNRPETARRALVEGLRNTGKAGEIAMAEIMESGLEKN